MTLRHHPHKLMKGFEWCHTTSCSPCQIHC